MFIGGLPKSMLLTMMKLLSFKVNAQLTQICKDYKICPMLNYLLILIQLQLAMKMETHKHK